MLLCVCTIICVYVCMCMRVGVCSCAPHAVAGTSVDLIAVVLMMVVVLLGRNRIGEKVMKLSKLCLQLDLFDGNTAAAATKSCTIATMLPVQHQTRARGSVLVCVVLVALQAIDCRNVGATGGSRVEGLLQEAQVLMQRKDFGSALPLLQEAVSVAPDHAAARFSLGMALLRSGKHIDAVRELEVMMAHRHRGEGELPPTQNLKMHSHH